MPPAKERDWLLWTPTEGQDLTKSYFLLSEPSGDAQNEARTLDEMRKQVRALESRAAKWRREGQPDLADTLDTLAEVLRKASQAA